jgi:hypothetical protein
MHIAFSNPEYPHLKISATLHGYWNQSIKAFSLGYKGCSVTVIVYGQKSSIFERWELYSSYSRQRVSFC